MLKVRLLPFPPRRLRRFESVAASLHDAGDALAEPQPDVVEPLSSALIFCCIVKERRDRIVFVSLVFEHERGYG